MNHNSQCLVELDSVLLGCNRTTSCLDWGLDGRLAFASCYSVVVQLIAPNSDNHEELVLKQVASTLVGHKNKVNCVKWISCFDSAAEAGLISGSVDQTIRVWQKSKSGCETYTCTHVATGHSGAVTALDSAQINGRTIIVTASADFTVKVWMIQPDSQEVEETQTINYGRNLPLCVTMTTLDLPNGCIFLACGVTDQKVHLYVRTAVQFEEVLILSGHEDWVRSVAFVNYCTSVFLASSGQDHMIRIWRITNLKVACTDEIQPSSDSADVATSNLGHRIEMNQQTFFIQDTKEKILTETSHSYTVRLETILSGHEGWVYSVCWQPGVNRQMPCLLSASMDKSLIVWRLDEDTGVWMDQIRVGEVGGNTLGFYGAVFSPYGDMILGHSYQGSLHQWQISDENLTMCKPIVTLKGHFDGVVDIAWDKLGRYVMSCSLDQTTRLFAPWIKSDNSLGWYELARPQIHGYDMQCLAMLSSFSFASAGDEKIVRIFVAPANFLENFYFLTELTHSVEVPESQPVGASVPALGLSNKAIYPDQKANLMIELDKMPLSNDQQLTELYFTSVSLSEPPTEEHLLQNTLWPEVQKLYSHSYEVFSLAAHPDGSFLASASKSTKADYANVILWCTSTWRPILSLSGPSLTVTQMDFSPDGSHLLAVSRDRTWHLYSRSSSKDIYTLAAHLNKKTSIHTRIIWSCAWSHDSTYFFTASRDKKVVAWNASCQSLQHTEPCEPVLLTEDSVTALDVACDFVDKKYLVAVGLDSGLISLYLWTDAPPSWQVVRLLDNREAHSSTVKRLRFRPIIGLADCRVETTANFTERSNSRLKFQLASCSLDFSVRIYSIVFDLL